MFRKNLSIVIELFPQKLWKLEAIKNYLRISHSYDDNLIENLINAAIIAAENFINLHLVLRNVHFICNVRNTQNFTLKYKPINKVKKLR